MTRFLSAGALSVAVAFGAIAFAQAAEQEETPKTPEAAQTLQGRVMTIANKREFSDIVLKAKGPVFVIFGAAWCPACQQTMPHIESLAKKREDALFVKLDVGPHYRRPDPAVSAVMNEYGVRGYPTLAVFSGGKAVSRRTGGFGAQAPLEQWLDGALQPRQGLRPVP